MKKLKVIATRDGMPGQPEEIGEVDRDDDFSWSGDRTFVSGRCGRQLAALFGAGYGDREFHLVDGSTMLVGCRIVGNGALTEIAFLRTTPAPT